VFFFFSHASFFRGGEVVEAEAVEDSVDEVEGEFFSGIEVVFFRIGESRFGADKDFSEMVLIDRKRNAVGGTRVVEKLVVQGTDLFRGDEINGDFFVGALEVLHQSFDHHFHPALCHGQRALGIMNRYLTQKGSLAVR